MPAPFAYGRKLSRSLSAFTTLQTHVNRLTFWLDYYSAFETLHLYTENRLDSLSIAYFAWRPTVPL